MARHNHGLCAALLLLAACGVRGGEVERAQGYREAGSLDDWKRLVFSEEQPWQDPDTKAKWLARKDEYRRLKSEGKV